MLRIVLHNGHFTTIPLNISVFSLISIILSTWASEIGSLQYGHRFIALLLNSRVNDKGGGLANPSRFPLLIKIDKPKLKL